MDKINFSGRACPRIVCVGGGTGMPNMLKGLKDYTDWDITGIVTVTDDGGGSGVIRDQLSMPPPGDIRNCLMALADTDALTERLVNYRFEDGDLNGQCFGNLLIAAMYGISGSFSRAIKNAERLLSVRGRVLPVTNDNVWIKAVLNNGTDVFGECGIVEAEKKYKCGIDRICLVPESAKPLKECIYAINDADVIVLGPGSLYTSVIPNILVDGISEAIMSSDALKIYICNLMTQPGETDGYTVSEHISAIFKHAGGRIFDTCVVNNWYPGDMYRYSQDGSYKVECDDDAVMRMGVEVFRRRIGRISGGFFRHDPKALAEAVKSVFYKACERGA